MFVIDATIDSAFDAAPRHAEPAAPQCLPTLLGIASAYPPFEVTMEQSWDLLFAHMSPQVRFGRRIIESTAVRKRHIMWSPETLLDACEMVTGDRMAAHADAVIEVASRSIGQAVEGFDTNRVGSLVMACSTGYVNPGPDLMVAKELGLRSDLRRTFIGHMGCYAAANVIKVAMDSVAARPDELVIGNCTELSSAHVRKNP
ncbi:MAG TPA: type III polyketide synthase, partial [Mycobacterium sp.]|nr:type III polyketide synthase [Mycobacterium sp.]